MHALGENVHAVGDLFLHFPAGIKRIDEKIPDANEAPGKT